MLSTTSPKKQIPSNSVSSSKVKQMAVSLCAALAFVQPLLAQDDIFAQDYILGIMHKVNDYTLANPYRETDRDWIRGTWYSGVMEAYRATGDGMLMATLDGAPWKLLRDGDPGAKGRVCHYMTTTVGISYEANFKEVNKTAGTISGLYDPATKKSFDFMVPKEWGYTHTGWDPEGRLWFWESSRKHHLEYLKGFDQNKKPVFEKLTGEWATYGKLQKSHFHPQLTPNRRKIIFVGGDTESKSNHIFLLDVSDLKDTNVITPDMLTK